MKDAGYNEAQEYLRSIESRLPAGAVRPLLSERDARDLRAVLQIGCSVETKTWAVGQSGSLKEVA